MRKPLLSILLSVGLAFAVTAVVVAEDALSPHRDDKRPGAAARRGKQIDDRLRRENRAQRRQHSEFGVERHGRQHPPVDRSRDG